MGMRITWDAGDAINAFNQGFQVIYHEERDGRIIPYEMDKNDKVGDFAPLDGRVAFFIYEDSKVSV